MNLTEVLLLDGPHAGKVVTCIGAERRTHVWLPKQMDDDVHEIRIAGRSNGKTKDCVCYWISYVEFLGRHIAVGLKGDIYDTTYENIADMVLTDAARKAWQ